MKKPSVRRGMLGVQIQGVTPDLAEASVEALSGATAEAGAAVALNVVRDNMRLFIVIQ